MRLWKRHVCPPCSCAKTTTQNITFTSTVDPRTIRDALAQLQRQNGGTA